MRVNTTILFLLLSCLSVYCQSVITDWREQISSRITKQLDVYPQEKIYLHTDRGTYIPEEKIWFKAYVADAFTHQYTIRSYFVYVELISPSNQVIKRVMIRPVNGLYHGNIELPKDLSDGHYTLCAYTRYQENEGEDFFFKKKIRIKKLLSVNEILHTEVPKSKKKATIPSIPDYEVSFFPEGGNLLDEVLCKVAFKALNAQGLPEEITGVLVDSKGEILTDTKTIHEGMGMFSFVPNQGESYFLECQNKAGVIKKIQLPATLSTGNMISCLQKGKRMYVSKHHTANIDPNETFYLLAHSRGFLLYFDKWDNNLDFITIQKDQLPAGIIQFMLLDSQMNPLSERLVFNKNNNLPQIVSQLNKGLYETRDSVSVLLNVTDRAGQPLIGTLSVAITDDKDISYDTTKESILTRMLLTSELKGHIESPGYYFENDSTFRATALDYLMMTHGWRRYNIPEVIKGNIKEPAIPFEQGQKISGQVKSLILGRPLQNAQITVIAFGGGFDLATTDEEGRFKFEGIENPDSTTYFVQSLNKRGGSRVELIMDKEKYPFIYPIPSQEVSSESGDSLRPEDPFLKKATERAKYDEYMRVVNLDEIEIVASKKNKVDEDMPWFASGADNTISRKEIEEYHFIRVIDLLYTIPGIHISGDNISIRGATSPPLILIDEIEAMEGTAALDMLNVDDIERIDVFKGPSAAIFGSRGGNGAISITTRKPGSYLTGEKMVFNQSIVSPLGFQRPVEFYAPKYDTHERKFTSKPDYRTTLYWKPDIFISREGKATFSFYTADFASTYTMVIEGMSLNGDIFYKTEKIVVK